MSLVPPSLAPLFREAGWHSGRRTAVADGIPRGHPAHALFAELGGLALHRGGSELIGFRLSAFADDARAAAWERELGTLMVCIAETENAHATLYLDTLGRCFANSLIHPCFSYGGGSFGEALERLLSRRRFRPMLLEDEEEVRFYGETLTRADGEVMTAADFETPAGRRG